MSYNGYPNYNRWNVSLWINNDEGLYNMARDHCRALKNKRAAARAIIDDLHSLGIEKTPDGAPYTVTAVLGALTGM
jgi:hypothetical protein